MRNTILASLLLVGCATVGAPDRFVEPARSEFYAACLGNNNLVSRCECIEENTVSQTGIHDVTKENANQVIQVLVKEATTTCNSQSPDTYNKAFQQSQGRESHLLPHRGY